VQSWAHSWTLVVVEVTVEVDVAPVASHRVIGASHTVVHAFVFACFFAPPKVVVAIAVHPTWQLLTVRRVHDEVEEDLDCEVVDRSRELGKGHRSRAVWSRYMDVCVIVSLFDDSRG
jgi:hypothetical protein